MARIEPLRPFQAEDLPWFMEHKKSLMLYEPRLGKTVEVCNILATDPEVRTVLICCSKNALSVWLDHLAIWWRSFPQNKGKRLYVRFVRGGKGERMESWKKKRPEGDNVVVFLTTYASYRNDYEDLVNHKMEDMFDTIIVDECHKVLRGRNNKTRDAFKKPVRMAKRFHALSGTLEGRWGPADYWTLLNLIRPSEFSSYWAFMKAFCITVNNGWGHQIIGVQNMDSFHEILRRFARVRRRADVAPQMPKVHRDLIWVTAGKEQQDHYDALGESKFTFLQNGNIIVAANSLENTLRKRQLLTCPKILDPSLGIGAAMENLVERLEESRDLDEGPEGTNVVIFTTFRAAIPHFEAYLRQHGFNHVGVLVGGTEPEDVTRIIKEFRHHRGIILGTTSFAQAFSLEPATQCFFIGYDYAPDNNKQAEDRLVPQVGSNPILSYYYAYLDTDDIELAEATNIKGSIIQSVIDAGYIPPTTPDIDI